MQYGINTDHCLKLSANSVYGCLSFTHSRFYAQHLAALVAQRSNDEVFKIGRNIKQAGNKIYIVKWNRTSMALSAYNAGTEQIEDFIPIFFSEHCKSWVCSLFNNQTTAFEIKLIDWCIIHLAEK